VLIGEVTGDYDFTPKAVSKDYPNIRKVKWLKKISRDNLSPQCKYAIGGIMTVFQVNGYLPEIKAILNEKTTEKVEIPEAEEPITEFYRHVHEKANEMISDLLSQIEAYDFQGLVAGVLRAMGFRTQESSPGQDLGVDILAHPDAFGFELPRIKVQVKHRKGAASAPEIRQLIGTLQVGENGLFVSTGGFTQGALREPGSGAKVTLVDHDKFTEFLLEHYEKLEPEYKALIPLRKVYIPTKPRL
jgi:restriction system protein